MATLNDEQAEWAAERSKKISTISIRDEFIQDENTVAQRKVSQNIRRKLSVVNPDKDLISNGTAILNLTKANIGTGIQAMPYAFNHAGLLVGAVFLPFIGFVAIHCMHLLVRCSHEVCRIGGEGAVDYATNAYKAFQFGRPATRKMAAFFKYTTNAFLISAQFGFCIVYYKYVAENIKQEFDVWYPESEISHIIYMLILLPLFTILGCIRSIKWITPLSTISNVLVVIGFGIIFYYLFSDMHPLSDRPAVAEFTRIPVFFGTAVFAFEGIGCILPIENKMQHPEAMLGKLGVINISMSIVVFAYLSVGFFGYLKYGVEVMDGQVIILNLPTDETLAQVAKFVMAGSIYLSYALQFYVPMEIILTWVKTKNKFTKYANYVELAVRLLFTLVVFLLAVAIPHIGVFIALLGAICGSSISLMYPPLMDSTLFADHPTWIHVKNMAIVLMGLVGFVLGTYISVGDLIATF